jgi:hypothetical protein
MPRKKAQSTVGRPPPTARQRRAQKRAIALRPLRDQTKVPAAMPVAFRNLTITGAPLTVRGKNSVRIRHKELVTGISANIAFGTYTYNINPGNVALFPWLSIQAVGWERYVFRSLRFVYLPRCSTASPGSVTLAPDYDAADTAPVNEAAACSYVDSASGPLWSDVICVCNPEALRGGMTNKYVRVPGPLASGLDIKTYDAGILYVATIDSASNSFACGKLWVEYDVELITPHTLPGTTNSSATYTGTIATPYTTLVAQAGPLISAAANSGITLNNMVPGLLYLLRAWADPTGGTAVSTNFSGLIGVNEVQQLITNRTQNAGGKGVVLESIIQPTINSPALSAALTGTATSLASAIEVIQMSLPQIAWSQF